MRRIAPAHPAFFLFAALLAWLGPLRAAVPDSPPRAFDVPAGDAVTTLKLAARQGGLEIVFFAEDVRDVRTPAVRGELTAREALERLVAGTGLAVVPGANGAPLAIRRAVPRAAPVSTDTMKPTNPLTLLASLFALGPVSAADAPAPARTASEETIQLSVFEVAAEKDDSYGSTNSNSITGTRKELRRMPVSAEVMNRTLLDDLGALEMREMLEFATGTAGFIISGGTSDEQGNQAGDRIGTAVGSLRGLSVGTRRNGFLSNGSSFDGFSKDRIEIIRGPQALLYGPTNASGIIVANTKRAAFARNSARAQIRIDGEGTRRGEFEFNAAGQLLRTGQPLALLVTAFDSREKFWRVNNEVDAKGWYLAGAWRPLRRVTVRADYETVHRHAVDPTTIRLSSPTTDPIYGSRNNRPLRLLLAQGRAADIIGGGLDYAKADAFATDAFGEVRDSKILSSQIEVEATKWLSFLVQGGFSNDDRIRYNAAAGVGLVPPGLGGNPTGDWGIQISPSVDPIVQTEKAWRGIAHLTLPKWRFLRTEFSLGGEARRSTSDQLGQRWFEIDASGEFIRNTAPLQLNNGNSGRTLMGNVWWAPNRDGFDGPEIFRSPTPNVVELNGRRYRRDYVRNAFPQFVTPDNPQGYSAGSNGINFQKRANDAVFGVISNDWFDGRVDSLVGYRYDFLINDLVPRPQDRRYFEKGSYMYGLNWHALRFATLYYAHSTSFQPSAGLDILNQPSPEGQGEGDEIGLKFNLRDERITGSISFYSSEARNNTANLPTEVRDVVDSGGINGRNGGISYAFDRETKGYEINLTAQPVRGWRVQAGFSHIAAREGSDVTLPILYNDQFNVNPAGQVTFGNGTPLRVPVAPNTTGFDATNPNPAVPTQILTVAMLRTGDAAGNYRANLDANSGRILNAGALYLNTPGIGTGVRGLPVAQHQLGFVSPNGSTFTARRGGDKTTGYAATTFSLTTNYRFSEGRLRGLAIGANARFSRDLLGYYYIDRTVPGTAVRRLQLWPDQTFVNAFVTYERRIFKRYTWRTQVNVSNVFDTVKVRIMPNVADGSPDNARLDAPPRHLAWTNSIRF